ncbi:MAG: hypothetical protein AMXMBFR23_02010 [Chloroflexota bacterium]
MNGASHAYYIQTAAGDLALATCLQDQHRQRTEASRCKRRPPWLAPNELLRDIPMWGRADLMWRLRGGRVASPCYAKRGP